jgi:tRNA(fMet)-specific endonuclease VapC
VTAVKNSASHAELMTNFNRLVFSERELARFSRLPVTDSGAEQFEWHKKQKIKIKQSDLIIACICLAHDATLVTRNVKDFKNVPGLKIENWAD